MKSRLLSFGFLVAAGLLLSACAAEVPPPLVTREVPDVSRNSALEYIGHSPTFRFDGMTETLKIVESAPGRESGTWDFVITFECRHGGYGDRAGKIVTQEITPHTARVTVRENQITRAILDDKWDEMQQKMTG